MKHYYATATSLLLSCLLSACATSDDGRSEVRRQLTHDLRKACIEANGGLQMDAIGLYEGRISSTCTAWAYQQARRKIR